VQDKSSSKVGNVSPKYKAVREWGRETEAVKRNRRNGITPKKDRVNGGRKGGSHAQGQVPGKKRWKMA